MIAVISSASAINRVTSADQRRPCCLDEMQPTLSFVGLLGDHADFEVNSRGTSPGKLRGS